MSGLPIRVMKTEDARQVIEELARRRGTFTSAFRQEAEDEAKNGRTGMLQVIEGSEEIRKDLAKALDIISTDLYSHRARFLMEVIQNADDNKYTEGKTPTVSITVFPRYVKIECNEEGFTREHIQALCRTGRSSKKAGEGYTGEKGIGFKSVFKVANRAHVRSFPYYFQLDKTRELGMVTPQWDEDFFDKHKEEYKTTIVLDRICDRSTDFSAALEDDINDIDPVLTLFLRRIERLHLTLFKSSKGEEPTISKRFQRVTWVNRSGIVSLKDEDANTVRWFYKQRLDIGFVGTEVRRPGVTETTIVLAFPLNKASGLYKPVIRKQNFVFAYLPLGDFGFKFAIQADFLTISNRESVDEDNGWNKSIASAIPRAFEAAINDFNSNTENSELNELANQWPLYLNDQTSGRSAYWRRISRDLIKHLSEARVIKDRTGRIRKPTKLTFLDWAHDRNGEPIFDHMSHYVSPDYPDSVREPLLSLGVHTPSWSWVCDKLKGLHDQGLLHTRRRNPEWCSDLAKVILEPKEPLGDERYVTDLKKIPLIPMADGTWRCPPSKRNPIYFPASLGTTVPPGLPLHLVDEEACVCPQRRKLFRLLGVKNCNVPNVIERILDYHAKFESAKALHLIAQLRYLFAAREHLQPGTMEKVYFYCPTTKHLQTGITAYADMSVDGELQQLFAGYGEAHFLDSDYFAELNTFESAEFAEWLAEEAGIALRPRFIALQSTRLHGDFEWLLENKIDQVLEILRQQWSFYGKEVTNKAKRTLADTKFMCISGSRAALRKAYVPLPMLLEKAQAFADAKKCCFLALPGGNPMDWKFLSAFDVGLDDGLDFYLWLLKQPGFKEHVDVEKSKQLYLAIQSRIFSPREEEKARKAFVHAYINLPKENFERLEDCAWHGPKSFPSKRALRQVYGHELDRLFQVILKVPSVTSAEAWDHLQKLRDDESTIMAEVDDVYVFLRTHCAHTFLTDDETACIAVPRSSNHALEWKTPAQCVWDDLEFSQNELKLESKTAIRHSIEKYAPTSVAFFTEVLKLPNAGVNELLADLLLMQEQNRDDPKRVYRIYERIESHRRSKPKSIKNAFMRNPLVFLRGINNQRGKWVSLKTCIWTRSILRDKHVLISSLNQYRDLFRDTLDVPNATVDMLVTDLMNASMGNPMEDEEDYQYIKELLRELARMPQDDEELAQLEDAECWPCRTPTCQRALLSIGQFYVNDRDDLFEMFSATHSILDFGFETSRKLASLLRNRGCDLFLSEKVDIQTEAREPLEYEHQFAQDFRSRADALVRYLEHAECEPPCELRSLLENAQVWMSTDIKTHYTLDDTTVTKSEGGCSVEVITANDTTKLQIYVSANVDMRNCALATDFPGQLVTELGLDLDDLFDLCSLLRVPLVSLKALLVKRGITGGDAVEDSEESGLGFTTRNILQRHHDSDPDDNGSDTATGSADSVVIESARLSAAPVAANMALRPSLHHRPSSRPTTPQLRFDDRQNIPSGDIPSEPPVTPVRWSAGLYSTDNRIRNRERLEAFARNTNLEALPRLGRARSQSSSERGAFDMRALGEAFEASEPAPAPTLLHVNRSPRRQAALIPNRNEREMARDFEVGFLGELFVYTLFQDTLQLPNFTAEDNWTSSLRSRAGFSTFGREVSDFTYKDTQGALTRHFLQMRHPYVIPEWLSTACDNGNAPLYRLEVKSTTSQDPTTTFYMSGSQQKLAKRLRITSAMPAEIYAILRVSALDALEDGARHRPQWRVYLDPYTCGENGILSFVAPTYAVTAAA